eukprot:TRINITY_DN767_c0_g1_i2.p1 TRINITY_DN767_c0_g1~~TRINITY_DN767_c0_g1_i2.p1  ORF type:complete len:472 (-),score=107.79 TRINITY_DN767_c0_g1_i2:72-1487(-)
MDLSKILGGPSYPGTASPPHSYANAAASTAASTLLLPTFTFNPLLHLPQPEILLSSNNINHNPSSPTKTEDSTQPSTIPQVSLSPASNSKRSSSKSPQQEVEVEKETTNRQGAAKKASTKNAANKRKSAKRSTPATTTTSAGSASSASAGSVSSFHSILFFFRLLCLRSVHIDHTSHLQKEKKVEKKFGLKETLRQLEIEAYSAVISAFRAQGELTWQKDRILQELRSVLKVSDEKHRLELLRVESDDTLNEIAKHKMAQIPLPSSNSDSESSTSESEADHTVKRRKLSSDLTAKAGSDNAYPPLMIHPLPSSDGAPAIIRSCIKKLPSKISKAIVSNSSSSTSKGGKGRKSSKDLGSPPPPGDEVPLATKSRKGSAKKSGAAKMLNNSATSDNASKTDKDESAASGEAEVAKPKSRKRGGKTKGATPETTSSEEKKPIKGKENERANGEDDEVEIMEDDEKEADKKAVET